MPTIVGVKLRGAAKPAPFLIEEGQVGLDGRVVVTTDRGSEIGVVANLPREAAEGEDVSRLRTIDRVANEDDLAKAEDQARREREALPVLRRLIAKHKLEMKPVEIEFLDDEGRIVFYFASEERVDFRELVRDLAAEFHARIDMRQVGVRDEARMIGGLGHCGEQLCCVRFGGEFQPVSIRMAKEQDLPLNPLKISGLCGRLMCCLRYEYDAYKDFKQRAPKKGAIIEIGDTRGKVVDFNTPRETMTVRMEQGGSMTVALEDMDCASGQGCPCRVRAEALEARAAAAATASIGSLAGGGSAASELREAEARPAITEEVPRPGGKSRRRRRRGGSGGEGAAETTEAPKSGQGGGQRQGQPKQGGGGQRQGQQKQGGGQRQGQRGGGQPTTGAAPAAGDAPAALPGRRRRRRRTTGGTTDAPAQ